MSGLPLNIDIQQILLHMLNFVILAGGLYFILYAPVKKPNSPLVQLSSLSSMLLRGAMMSFT